MKTLAPYWIHHDDEDGTATKRVHVSASRREIRAGIMSRHWLWDNGITQEQGCSCSHCMMDWDCCGRLYPSTVSIERVRGGYRVSQHYPRNV